MHIVGFYVAKKRLPLKTWQKVVLVVAVAGGFYALLLLYAPAALALVNPDWSSLGKTWGNKLGEKYWLEARRSQAVVKGPASEVWKKEWFHPACEYARRCIIDAKESNRLTEGQMKALHRMLDQIMREETAKTYNDDWHRVFAKVKGGKISEKLSTYDMINIGDYVADPENFDWARWTMPGTGNYKAPPTTGLYEAFMRRLGLWKAAPALPGVGGNSPIDLPGVGGEVPILVPSSEQGLASAPALTPDPATLPGFSRGFAYLHGLPSQAEQMVQYDGPMMAPEWFPVWVIPIIIIIFRALGLPL